MNDKYRELLEQAITNNNKNIIKELAELVNSDEEIVYNSIKILKKIISEEAKEQGLSFGTALNILLKN